MENKELAEKLEKIEINKNNDNSLNSNNNTDSKSEYYKEINTNDELKIGQFMLTPLECLIINKKMPKGYKFEPEEMLIKSIETTKITPKKIKKLTKHVEHQINEKPKKIHTENNNNNNLNKDKDKDKDNIIYSTKKMKKLIHKENSLNNINNNMTNNNNSESYKIMMKCFSCFNKIKLNPYSNIFYFPKSPDSPSLSKIEKKIKNYEYKTINDFCEDLRKLWNFQFKNYAKNPNIYQNICKMSLLSDKICKELSNNNNNSTALENKKNEFSNIKKRTDKIKKDIDEIKGNNQNNIYNKNLRQKNLEQINRLGQLIKELNKQQLRGIVPILSDKKENNNLKFFEFDLDQLPPDKFKKLEEYVHNCINTNRKINNKNHILNNKNNGLNKVNNNNKKENISKKKIIESGEKNKTNINKNIIYNNKNNMVKNENIDKNYNLKDKNTDNETAKTENGNKIIKENKSFSESDSFSSESSLSD